MSQPSFIRSGTTAQAIDANMSQIETLLALYLDATPSASDHPELTIDLNGHTLVNVLIDDSLDDAVAVQE